MSRLGRVGQVEGGRRTRRAPALVLVAGLAVAALLLGACSNTALALARQACTHVDHSIKSYERAQRATTSTAAAADLSRATRQLEAALPLAAAANSANPEWNPLMTTLQEIGRTPEGDLVSALKDQCAAAVTPAQQGPIPGTQATQETTTTRPSH